MMNCSAHRIVLGIGGIALALIVALLPACNGCGNGRAIFMDTDNDGDVDLPVGDSDSEALDGPADGDTDAVWPGDQDPDLDPADGDAAELDNERELRNEEEGEAEASDSEAGDSEASLSCKVGSYRCASDSLMQFCDPNGEIWKDFKTCAPGSKCANDVCSLICTLVNGFSDECHQGYFCDDITGVCRRVSACSYDSECPGVLSYCQIAPGETYGTCERLCSGDQDCEGCTYCELDSASPNYSHCIPFAGVGACDTTRDCPDPASQVCSHPRESCARGVCVRSCASAVANCKIGSQTCNFAPNSPTFGTCIDIDICVPCADDDDCGKGGRCGWKEDNGKPGSGCCEWMTWKAISLCHNACKVGSTCFPKADACGTTSCPDGQCVAPDGGCGACTCPNPSPYCVPVVGDTRNQGTCCAGYECVLNTCVPQDCGDPRLCVLADGTCGACAKCVDPTSCGLGLPPCCTGSTCKIAAGQSTGVCEAVGCYGKSCDQNRNDCCEGTPSCYLADENSSKAFCL